MNKTKLALKAQSEEGEEPEEPQEELEEAEEQQGEQPVPIRTAKLFPNLRVEQVEAEVVEVQQQKPTSKMW